MLKNSNFGWFEIWESLHEQLKNMRKHNLIIEKNRYAMRSFFFILAILFSCFSYAQDVIIFRTGEDIKVKALTISQDELVYKMWDNLEGPDYIVPLPKLFMITFENGTLKVFNAQDDDKVEEAVSQPVKAARPTGRKKEKDAARTGWVSKREGLHIGFHMASGLGAIFGESSYYDNALGTVNVNYSEGFSSAGGLDLKYYFGQYVGVKTGIGYEYINYKSQLDIVKYSNFSSNSDFTVTNATFPLQFLLTSGKGKNIGFYLETGVLLTVPVASTYSQTVFYNGDYDIDIGNMADISNSVSLSTSTAIGINVPFSSIANLNIGGFFHYGLTEYFTNDKQSYVLVYGLQIGLSVNKKK